MWGLFRYLINNSNYIKKSQPLTTSSTSDINTTIDKLYCIISGASGQMLGVIFIPKNINFTKE